MFVNVLFVMVMSIIAILWLMSVYVLNVVAYDAAVASDILLSVKVIIPSLFAALVNVITIAIVPLYLSER